MQGPEPTIEQWRERERELLEKLRRARDDQGAFQAGDYNSTVPSRELVAQRTGLKRPIPAQLPGIALNPEHQLALLAMLRPFGAEYDLPDRRDGVHHYYGVNDWFETPDAIALYCLMRHGRPKKIIEVGSGFSSALMLDVNANFFDGALELIFIEPDPKRFQALLRPGEKPNARVVGVPVEELTSDAIFRTLEPNDILLIDSSHVLKYGNDLAHLLWNILPALAPGVLVHFHDIFYPFEYPEEWLGRGVFWNECYVLRAYLTDNPTYRIELFSDYLNRFHAEALHAVSPRWIGGGSLWLRKLAPTG